MARHGQASRIIRRALLLVAACSVALTVQAADPNKVVRFAFRGAETSFDPAKESDRYSAFIMEAVFDTLLTYDYLARPAKLRPNVIEAMPEVADGGASYTFHLKKGIYFTPDPAFNGKRRELVAQDFVYGIKRFFDPKLRSPYLYYFEGKIIGADEAMARAKKTGSYDYDALIPGLQALDRYTLHVRLKEPDFNFLYILATPTAFALAREAVEKYGDDIGSHPVGTNAYMLHEWRRSSKIVLLANPDYREDYFHSSAEPADPEYRAISARLNGKRLPIAGRIEVSIIEEPQPRWLGFLNKEFDYLEELPNEFVNVVAPNAKLAPNLAKMGIGMQRTPELEITMTSFYNMDDPVIGGYTSEKIALRRAMNMGYNQREEINIARKGQAMAAESPIPPGAAGYDADFHSIATEYDPAKAKALLDMFGYKDVDGDGYRELPNGKPLVLEMGSPPTADFRDLDLVWKKSMDAIGINVTFKKERWPDLNKEAKGRTLQIGNFYAWSADYPDGDNFLSLLYGPNSSPQSNFSNFDLPEFNKLYEQARSMPDSPERTKIYDEMSRLFLAYAPWRLGVHRVWTNLTQPWLLNYRKHPIMTNVWKVLDVDLDMQRRMSR